MPLTSLPSTPAVRRRRWLAAALIVVVLAALAGATKFLPGGWEEWVTSLPATGLLLALALLPIVGFPISALHIATGARFGVTAGLAAVAATTVVHLLGSFVLARWLDRPTRRLLTRLGWHLAFVPAQAAWPFTFWIALLPGVSYALKNYIPPLGGVSLRVYLGAHFPLHVLHALVGLSLGHATIKFNWTLGTLLAVYIIVLTLLTRSLTRRFRGVTAARAGDEVVAIR